jgi:anti-sigma B factor antagonist
VIRLHHDHDEGVATLYLSGDIDLYAGDKVDQTLAAVAADGQIIVECADVEFIDSSGLRALMFHWRRLHEAGGRLRVRDPSSAVRRVIELFGVEDLLL